MPQKVSISLKLPYDFLECLMNYRYDTLTHSFTGLVDQKGDTLATKCDIEFSSSVSSANLTFVTKHLSIDKGTIYCHLNSWNLVGNVHDDDDDNDGVANFEPDNEEVQPPKMGSTQKPVIPSKTVSKSIPVPSQTKRLLKISVSRSKAIRSGNILNSTQLSKQGESSKFKQGTNLKRKRDRDHRYSSATPSKRKRRSIKPKTVEEIYDDFLGKCRLFKEAQAAKAAVEEPVKSVQISENKDGEFHVDIQFNDDNENDNTSVEKDSTSVEKKKENSKPSIQNCKSKSKPSPAKSKDKQDKRPVDFRTVKPIRPNITEQRAKEGGNSGKSYILNCPTGPFLNIPSLFPLIDMNKILKIEQVRSLTGRHLTLTGTYSQSKNGLYPNVSFYTNIVRGVDIFPAAYPKKLHVILVNDAATLPVVISLKRNAVSKKKKLKTSPEPTLSSSKESQNNSLENIGSPSSSGQKIEAVVNTLQKKLESSQQDEVADSSSSSESADEYSDEEELLKIPRLEVINRPNLTTFQLGFFRTLKVGQKIGNIDFIISSTQLLRTEEDYYVLGNVSGVTGITLLGPFHMCYTPLPFLNFVGEKTKPTRIPTDIYERRRQRWIRKHEKRSVIRPNGGEPADEKTANLDHDYFIGPHKTHASDGAADVNMTEDPSNEKSQEESEESDVVITKTHGLQLESQQIEERAISVNRYDFQDVVVTKTHGLQFPWQQETQKKMMVIQTLEEALTPSSFHETLHMSDSQHETQPNTDGCSVGQIPASDGAVAVPNFAVDVIVDENGQQSSLQLQQTSQLSDLNPRFESESNLNVVCQYCLQMVKSQFRLIQHIKNHHSESPFYMQYINEIWHTAGVACTSCDKRTLFRSRDAYKSHMRVQHPEKVKDPNVDKRTCPTCKKVFGQRGSMLKHVERVHKKTVFLCHKCPGIFKSKEILQIHIKGQHDNIRNHSCHLCGASFVTKYCVNSHIRKVHHKKKTKTNDEDDMDVEEQTGSFEEQTGSVDKIDPKIVAVVQKQLSALDMKACSLCGYTFDPPNLKKHLKQIHGIETVEREKCKDCTLTFDTRPECEIHRDSEHFICYAHNCPYCGNSYVRSSSLELHVVSQHFEITKFPCSLCDKIFKNHVLLGSHNTKEHGGAHKMDMDMKCLHCTDQFETPYTLVQHLLSPAHNDVFPFKCSSSRCNYHFIHEKDLKHHEKLVHKETQKPPAKSSKKRKPAIPNHDFEIRCSTDDIVHLVVRRNINSLRDLPEEAQIVLEKLKECGKQVVIIPSSQFDKEKAAQKTILRSLLVDKGNEANSIVVGGSDSDKSSDKEKTVTDSDKSTDKEKTVKDICYPSLRKLTTEPSKIVSRQRFSNMRVTRQATENFQKVKHNEQGYEDRGKSQMEANEDAEVGTSQHQKGQTIQVKSTVQLSQQQPLQKQTHEVSEQQGQSSKQQNTQSPRQIQPKGQQSQNQQTVVPQQSVTKQSHNQTKVPQQSLTKQSELKPKPQQHQHQSKKKQVQVVPEQSPSPKIQLQLLQKMQSTRQLQKKQSPQQPRRQSPRIQYLEDINKDVVFLSEGSVATQQVGQMENRSNVFMDEVTFPDHDERGSLTPVDISFIQDTDYIFTGQTDMS